MGKKYISITKGAFDVLLPRFGFGDVDQAAIVNDRFGKRRYELLLSVMPYMMNHPRKLHQRL